MTVTMNTADSVLKTAYLDVVSEYLDYKANPFLAKIKKTSDNVWGKEIKKAVRFGINGGVGAGTEDGDLPGAAGSNYKEFVIGLKNLYGTIEISDKAIRASQNKTGAITNILNDEMESLMKAAELNFSRMIFGNGKGVLSDINSFDANIAFVDKTYNFVVGMKVSIISHKGEILNNGKTYTVIGVDKEIGLVRLAEDLSYDNLSGGEKFVVAGSYNNELTGIDALFDDEITKLYGLNKDDNQSLLPVTVKNIGALTEMKIQSAIDEIEDRVGGKINFILCSSGVKRALIEHMSTYKRNVDVLDLQGGFKSISFNGIPVVSDRFCPPGTMYLLNSDDFAIHQLCDWEWLENEDGKILKQIPNKPVYKATLVKYAELLCSRPWGQAKLTGITEV